MFSLTICLNSTIYSDPNEFFITTNEKGIDQLSFHQFQFVMWNIRI